MLDINPSSLPILPIMCRVLYHLKNNGNSYSCKVGVDIDKKLILVDKLRRKLVVIHHSITIGTSRFPILLYRIPSDASMFHVLEQINLFYVCIKAVCISTKLSCAGKCSIRI